MLSLTTGTYICIHTKINIIIIHIKIKNLLPYFNSQYSPFQLLYSRPHSETG